MVLSPGLDEALGGMIMEPLALKDTVYHYNAARQMERFMLKMDSRPAVGNWLDGAATCASAACLIHCLVLPLIIAALPSLAGSIDPGERFHALVLAFAIPTSALALVPGWRASGAAGPLSCGLVGLVLLAISVAIESSEVVETLMTVVGSLCLAGAHFANWRLRRAQCLGGDGCSC